MFLATSSPASSTGMAASVSVFEERKQRSQDNFLAGRARSAHRLCESVESSIIDDNPVSSYSSVSSTGCRRVSYLAV